MKAFLKALGAAAATLVIAFAGTVMHSAQIYMGSVRLPLGLVLASLLMVACAAFFRAALGFAGIAGCVIGAFIGPEILAATGPGGDVLVQGNAIGYIWLVLSWAGPLAMAFAPRAWFRGGRTPTRGQASSSS